MGGAGPIRLAKDTFSMPQIRPTAVIVLAAGQGTRMKSALPKVMHPIGGRSLLHHAIAAAEGTSPDHLVVVGRGRILADCLQRKGPRRMSQSTTKKRTRTAIRTASSPEAMWGWTLGFDAWASSFQPSVFDLSEVLLSLLSARDDGTRFSGI